MYHASSRSSQALKLTPIKRDPNADIDDAAAAAAAAGVATSANSSTTSSSTTTTTATTTTDVSAEAANKKPMPAPRPSAAATAAAATATAATAGGAGGEPAPLPAKPTKKINPPPSAIGTDTLSRESTIASVPSHDALEKLATPSESGAPSTVVVGRRNVMATARFDSKTRTPKELEFKKGDTILVLEVTDAEWWKAQKGDI